MQINKYLMFAMIFHCQLTYGLHNLGVAKKDPKNNKIIKSTVGGGVKFLCATLGHLGWPYKERAE